MVGIQPNGPQTGSYSSKPVVTCVQALGKSDNKDRQGRLFRSRDHLVNRPKRKSEKKDPTRRSMDRKNRACESTKQKHMVLVSGRCGLQGARAKRAERLNEMYAYTHATFHGFRELMY